MSLVGAYLAVCTSKVPECWFCCGLCILSTNIGHSLEGISLPCFINISTVSLLVGSGCMQVKWINIDCCTSTAAAVHSGPVLHEAQQSQCRDTEDQLVSKIHSRSLLNCNQLFSDPVSHISWKCSYNLLSYSTNKLMGWSIALAKLWEVKVVPKVKVRRKLCISTATKLQCRVLSLFSCQLLLVPNFVKQWGASNLLRSDAAAFHLRLDWVEVKRCIECKNNVCMVCTACKIIVLHVIRAGAKLTSPVSVLYWMLTWLAVLSTWHCLYAGFKHWSFTIHYKHTLNLNKSDSDGLFTMVL